MSNQLAVQKKEEIQSFIETIVMNEPSLKDKLTVAVALNYLQMPDSAFGWNANGAMPYQQKLMCIGAHLQAGAKIGYGQIYFLGNKLYQSADFVRSQAASNDAWKIAGEAKFIPHTEAEKAAYGLQAGDMSIKCVMDIKFKGEVFRAEGDGIIGKDELAYRSQSGKPKAGLDTTKNRIMSLKTRAMRDLYNRFYPTNGLPVAPEHAEEIIEFDDKNFVQQVKTVNETSTPESRQEVRAKVIEANEVDLGKEERKVLDGILEKIKEQSKTKNIKLGELWQVVGCKTQADFKAKEIQEIKDGLEAMSDFVDNYKAQAEATEMPPIAKAALSQYDKNVKVVEGMGGLPTKILGFNHLNVLEYTDAKMIQEASKKLEAFIAEKGKEVSAKLNPEVPPMPEPPLEDDPFADFADVIAEEKMVQDQNSLMEINKLLKHPNVKDEGVRERLKKLTTCALKAGDNSLIVQAARVGQGTKNYKDLDDLIKARS
jgi:hypothetical protein